MPTDRRIEDEEGRERRKTPSRGVEKVCYRRS